MGVINDFRKRQALVLWANRQLAEAMDFISNVETGERFQVIRLQSDGTHDDTQKAYLKAMQDICHLEWLLEILQDQSDHQRSDDAIVIPNATPDHQ